MSDSETWQAPDAPTLPPASAAGPPPRPTPYQPPPPQGMPHGWTPPPKPGLIPLRPLTLGPILSASFQVMRRNPRATLAPALILSVLITIVTAVGLSLYISAATRIAFGASGDDAAALAAGSLVVGILVLVLGGAVVAVATAVLQALIVTEVARGTVGEKLSLPQIWAKAGNRIGAVIGYTVLLIVAAAIGIAIYFAIVVGITVGITTGSSSGPGDVMGVAFASIGLILLGYAGALVIAAWLGTRLAFVPAAIVLERLSIPAAVARSWTLTRGYFWRTFGIQLLVAVMIYFATQIVSIPISVVLQLGLSLADPTGGGTDAALGVGTTIGLVLSAAVVAVVTAVGLVLQAATASLLYLDLRMRKEGLDLELMRFVEARQTGADVADPYLPHRQAPAPAAS